MNEDLSKARNVFREEAYELLAELENSLLELETAPDNKEMIERAFRAMHTLKGSSLMFGFENIANLTHEAETLYDMVRRGETEVTRELIDMTFRIMDRIKDILCHPSGPESEGGVERERPPSLSSGKVVRADTKVTKATYRIYFRPDHNIFRKGSNPLLLFNEICRLGRCTVVAHTDFIPSLEDIDPEACYTYWDIFLTTAEGINAIKDVFIFTEDDCELRIDALDHSGSLDNEEAHKHLEKIISEKGELPENLVADLILNVRSMGNDSAATSSVEESRLIDHLQPNTALGKGHHLEVSSIRVAAQKLDKLVNLVGELVTVQARLSQAVISRDDPELLMIAEEVERLTDELRDSSMNIRLIPIGTIFNRFRRLVRDLSNELGKEVKFVTEGEETELDKNVIEKLNDPLVHIIRNSIDHGIEPPETRIDAGKKAAGVLQLSAEYSGAAVLIRIRDDGAGIDLERIRRYAIERGLLKEDTALSEKDMLSFIFSPGFSTSERVTRVSGRGVGLDVVKRSIEALRGTVDVESKKGAGITITLRIPLTLAIIEGLLLKVGNSQYIVPLSAVEECIELIRDDAANAHGRNIINVRGKIVPYIRLRDFFHTDGVPPDIEQVVITEVSGKRIGLAVDHVIGEHQTVIKSLGRVYKDVEVVSGATILGNGMVAIILNIPKIIEHSENEETDRVVGSLQT